ncbi:MAG: hypothetical protein IJT43_05400 [Stomatobaculum sp.]|nr:hypothetical protein [Stomatobaculum sp.]
MQKEYSRLFRETREENGRQLVSGLSAVRLGAGRNPRMETSEGVVILPAEAGASGGVRLRDSGNRHLPEFYPADPEEAFRMARSASLYADTYRTPILVRLDYEVRCGMAEIGPVRPGAAEKRRDDYQHTASARLPEAFSDSAWNRVSGSGRRGIIVRGPAALKLPEILNGYPAGRILRLGTPWPFPEERVRDYLTSISEVLVLDEERDRLLTAVYAVKGKYDLHVRVHPFYGEECSERDLREALLRFLGKDAEKQLLKIGTPPERSLWGMPVLPQVLIPEKALGEGSV